MVSVFICYLIIWYVLGVVGGLLYFMATQSCNDSTELTLASTFCGFFGPFAFALGVVMVVCVYYKIPDKMNTLGAKIRGNKKG